ncbi:MAG: 3-keto-disaccharide hydrolase [Actinomycetota bacterium]
MRSRVPLGITLALAALVGLLPTCDSGPSGDEASMPIRGGRLISTPDMDGWQHTGEGGFDVTVEDGRAVYTSRGGLGLLWYEEPLDDFELALRLQVAEARTNSGVFLRVPDPSDPAYISRSFEVQIDTGGEGTAATGAIFDVQSPIAAAPLAPGVWHRMDIRAVGPRVQVWIDGVVVNDFLAHTGGEVSSYELEGFVGLQNHSAADVVRFRDVRLRSV